MTSISRAILTNQVGRRPTPCLVCAEEYDGRQKTIIDEISVSVVGSGQLFAGALPSDGNATMQPSPLSQQSIPAFNPALDFLLKEKNHPTESEIVFLETIKNITPKTFRHPTSSA